MGKQISLTLAVLDEFIELVENLRKAHEPGQIPPISERDAALWGECLKEARDNLEQHLRKRADMVTAPPAGGHPLPKAQNLLPRFRPAVMRRAERLYWERSPEKKRIVGKIVERFRRLFDRHRVAFMQDWRDAGYPVDTLLDYYFDAANPEARYKVARAVVLQDLYRLRLELENSAKSEERGAAQTECALPHSVRPAGIPAKGRAGMSKPFTAVRIVCLNERVSASLRKSLGTGGPEVVSTLDQQPLYDLNPVLYLHSPAVVLDRGDARGRSGDLRQWANDCPTSSSELLDRFEKTRIGTGAPVIGDAPVWPQELEPAIRRGSVLGVVFLEKALVDSRLRCLPWLMFEMVRVTRANHHADPDLVMDAAERRRAWRARRWKPNRRQLFGHIRPRYTSRLLEPLVPSSVGTGAGLGFGIRHRPMKVNPAEGASESWAARLIEEGISEARVVVGEKDSTVMLPHEVLGLPPHSLTLKTGKQAVAEAYQIPEEEVAIQPLYENGVGEMLGCAVRVGKGAVLVLPECRDQEAKAKVLRRLVTDLWDEIQEWCKQGISLDAREQSGVSGHNREGEEDHKEGEKARDAVAAARKFLSSMLEYASAVPEELRRCTPSIRPNVGRLRDTCQALQWQLRALGVLADGQSSDLTALEGYGVPGATLMSVFSTDHRSRGRPAMESLRDLAEKTLEVVVQGGSGPPEGLVKEWDQAIAQLTEVAENLEASITRREKPDELHKDQGEREPRKAKGGPRRPVVPEEVMKRLREIPAKSEKDRQVKVEVWTYRDRTSEEIAEHVKTETGKKLSNSRIRQIRSEVTKWVNQGPPRTLSQEQERDVRKVMGRLRKIYSAIPGPQWREIEEQGDLRQEVTSELLATGDSEEAERAGKRFLDERRRDAKRQDTTTNPDTMRPYDDDDA